MNRNDLIKLLGVVLALQLMFTLLHYVGGYDVDPTVSAGMTGGLTATYLARKRRKSA